MGHKASCYCGAIRLEASGDAAIEVYCHCTSCRTWSGQPVTACLLWPEDSVTILFDLDQLHRYSKTNDPKGGKYSCKTCGGAVCAFLPSARMYDIFGGVLNDYQFRPTAHINYQERVFDLIDGLPKFRDMPDTVGGSGRMLDEQDTL